jgi:L-fuculose-phosphate aldolase
MERKMNEYKAKLSRIEVCEAAKKMYSGGLVAGTWGNISARIDDKYMAITPSGMDYEKLRPDEMVIVDMDTLEYEGGLKPSIEVPMHAAIFHDRPNVNGIMHTHSTYALCLATAQKPIPPICDDQVQILGGDIRVSPYTRPSTKEMADEVTKALRGRYGALIANHGAVTLGIDLDKAYIAAQVLEKTSLLYINTQSIGGPVEIPEEDIAFFHDYFMNCYGQKD